jgi:hypothetical protein
MDRRSLSVGRRRAALILGVLGVALAASAEARAGRKADPAAIVPLDQIAADRRASVAEVVAAPTFHRQGKPETFPANPRLYLSLLNEPAVTLALWQDLYPTTAKLRQVAPGRYSGTDGNGATATWEYVHRSPRLHVLYSDLQYNSPRGNARLEGRIVLVVRTGFFKEVNGEPWVQHDVEAFVKIDSRGWKAVAATVRPIIEKLLADQVQEAGWFVSLMARLVEMHPDWAVGVIAAQPQVPAPTRKGFQDLVAETRRPGASTGRPTAMAARDAGATRR